jgi:hypothetical protein
VGFDEGRVHVQRRRRRGRALLQAGDERVVRLPEPRERSGLLRDRGVRSGLPEREVLGVAGLQEVAHRGGRGQRVAQQRGQRVILAERREILAAVAARDPEGDQTLHELRGAQAPLPLLDRNARIDRRRDAELAEQLDHQRDARAGGHQARVHHVIEVEGQLCRRLGHRVSPEPRVHPEGERRASTMPPPRQRCT